MTDEETIRAARFSLLPLVVPQLPSENVLRACVDEPFVLHHGTREITVWFDEDGNFAASDTKACREQGVGHELVETYAELAELVRADRDAG